MIENELLQKNNEKEPEYTNYYTWYRFYQNLKEDLNYKELFKEFKTRVGVDICFAKIFRILENFNENISSNTSIIKVKQLDKQGSVTLLIGIWLKNFSTRSSTNNYCLIDPKYIDEWCRAFKDVVNYEVTTILDNPEDPESCIVRLDFPKLSNYGNTERLLLTWVRYLYEAPYNYIPIEALRLKRLKKFKKYSLITLFNLASHCCDPKNWWGTGHSICKGGGIYPKKYIKEFMTSSSRNNVNDICRQYRYTGQKFLNAIKPMNMGDMLSQKNFEVRLKTYEEAIEVFNEHLQTIENKENEKSKKTN